MTMIVIAGIKIKINATDVNMANNFPSWLLVYGRHNQLNDV